MSNCKAGLILNHFWINVKEENDVVKWVQEWKSCCLASLHTIAYLYSVRGSNSQSLPWKGSGLTNLPTRTFVTRRGIEPLTLEWKSNVLTTWPTGGVVDFYFVQNHHKLTLGIPDGVRTRNLQIESLTSWPVTLQEHISTKKEDNHNRLSSF